MWADSALGCSEGAAGRLCKALSVWQCFLISCAQKQLVLWQPVALQGLLTVAARGKKSPQIVTALAAVMLEGAHLFLCSLPLSLVMCSLGRYCAYTTDVCLLVLIRLNAGYSFVGSVLYWIWMEYCNDINEVVFAADCFPLPKVRPFTVKSSFFSNLSGQDYGGTYVPTKIIWELCLNFFHSWAINDTTRNLP